MTTATPDLAPGTRRRVSYLLAGKLRDAEASILEVAAAVRYVLDRPPLDGSPWTSARILAELGVSLRPTGSSAGRRCSPPRPAWSRPAAGGTSPWPAPASREPRRRGRVR